MSVRSQAQVQVNQTSDSPLQTGILQRSMGHEHSVELDAQPSLDAQLPQISRFQQNFSRVSVRSSSLPFIQPKLKIGRPGDRYEQEADRVADQVMRTPNVKTAQSIKPVAPGHHALLQRQPEVAEDKDEDEEEVVQTKPALGQTPSVTPGLQTQLHAGGGQALPQRTREAMESRFHHDFKGVRVHSDRHAANLNHQMHAQAFTHGQHIYFGQGYYQPSTFRGQHLLAHELTHVVQQTGGHTEGQIVQRLDLSEAQTGLGQPISVPSVNSTRPTISPTSINLQKQEEEGSILSDIASGLGINLSQYLDDIPGYTLFTVIIEYDPIRGLGVERNAISLVQGLLGLLGPIGNNIFATLQEYEILQQAFDWIEVQLDQFNLSRERFARAINDLKDAALDVLPTSLGEVIQLFDRYVGSFARDVVAFTRSLIEQLIAQIKAVAIDFAEGLLDENPAWDLLKKVLHYDPLRGEEVEASTVEILTDFLMLIGKEQELEQMQERGTLQETADWLDTQLGIFLGLLLQLTNLLTNAWAAIQPENLPNLSANLEGLANQAVQFLQGLGEFALTIALKVLEIIKNALLALLREHANTIPGYHLITVMVEKDVFTQEEVPLTPTNLIHGFMSLIPGGEEQFQQMQETGVIPEAAQRIETAMTELGISWPFVRQLFLDIWDSFTIEDMVSPADTFVRVLNEFSEPLGRLFTFVIEVIKVMLELVLVLMNFPTDLIGSIITNALQALDDIQRDPVGFLMNLIETMKLGFSNFFDNIVEHLIGGLADWLFAEVREAGIEPPADLTFESILGFVLDILGLSIDHLWELLAEHVGQETVDRIRGAIDRLAGAWSFIQDVQERGIVAVWEYIESQLNNLWDMVLAQVQDWTMERIIDVGMRWLLSLLDATGITPVINSAIAVFNAIQSAIEYLNEMLAVVNDFVSTVASIARGDIQPGAERMEQGLSNSLPIVIGFLANQFGLGDIGDRLQEIIAGARELVDAGLNWLIEQALRLGQAVLRSLGLGQENPGGEAPVTENLEVDKSLTMSGEGHHIYAETHNNRLIIEIASGRRQLLETLVSSTIYREERGANRSKLLEQLNEIDEKLKNLAEDWAAAYSKDDEQKRASILTWIGTIADVLQDIGREYGIPNLENLGHPSKYVEGNQLKPEYANQVRDLFYPSGYRTSTEAWFDNRLKNLTNPNDSTHYKDEITQQWELKIGNRRSQPTIDHTLKVADHWSKNEGNNVRQNIRADFYNDTSKMRITAWKNNSSDGAMARKEGVTYVPNVGSDFRGPNDND